MSNLLFSFAVSLYFKTCAFQYGEREEANICLTDIISSFLCLFIQAVFLYKLQVPRSSFIINNDSLIIILLIFVPMYYTSNCFPVIILQLYSV